MERAMSDNTILNCPSCGAQLRITADLDRVTCQNCHNGFVVNRLAGGIALDPFAKEMKPAASVSLNHAEQAVQRLKGEISQLEKDISRIKSRDGISFYRLLWLIPIVLIPVGVAVWLIFSAVDVAVGMIAIGLAATLIISLGNIEKAKQGVVTIKNLEDELDKKRTELTKHLQIASNGK
jgi:hypothetical protein